MRKKFIEFDNQLINVKEIVFVGKVTGININARKGQYGIYINVRDYESQQEWFKSEEDRNRRFNEIKEDLC